MSLVAVEYNATVGNAGKFFKEPWLLSLPKQVQDECFDLVLLDGPPGFLETDPGRMEAAYYSLMTAKRCLFDQKLDAVYIFLHDANRYEL